MSDPNDNYMGILLEEIRDQNKAVLEAVGDMKQNVAKIPAMVAQLQQVADDVVTIKAAVKAINMDVADHDSRLAQLEQAA